MKLTAVVTPAIEGGYCALNPETGTVSQGETAEEAVGNLREAVGLYLEALPFAHEPNDPAPVVTAFEVAAGKRQAGIEPDTNRIEFALATVALEDHFAEAFIGVCGKIDPELKLGY